MGEYSEAYEGGDARGLDCSPCVIEVHILAPELPQYRLLMVFLPMIP